MGELALAVVDTYEDLFIEYVIGGVRASLAQVQAHEYVVPDAVREQAWHVLSFALDVDAAWEVTKELLLELAPKMELMGFRETWIPYLEQGVRKSQEQQDQVTMGSLYYQLGVFYRLAAQHYDALHWLNEGRQLFAEINEIENLARCHNQLAYVAWQQGQVEETISNAKEALALLPEHHVEQAMAYSALGLIAVGQQKFDEAESYFLNALEIRELHGEKRLIAWSLQNLAISIMHQAKFDAAIKYYEKALTLLRNLGDYANQAIVYMNIGLAYYQQGKVDNALKNYDLANTIFIKVGDKLNSARLMTNQGLAFYEKCDFQMAEFYFNQSMTTSAVLGNNALRLNAISGLIMTKIAQDNNPEAANLLSSAMAELEQLPDLPNYIELTEYFEKYHSKLIEKM
ncbi:MAG: tetratricopeptide repeat protein [Caldilineaceae bacterium]|nr:tetratricopeptide repeat protein [Caldilineaceae bacterium]